jgi:regulator of protease activity HflC (stomatin/prohibitin superfamily)
MSSKFKYPNVAQALSRFAVVGVAGLVVILILSGLMTTTISSGFGGVRYSIFGGTDLSSRLGEGLKVFPPWVKIYKYDLRVQEHLEQLQALSSNGLSIEMDVSVRARPDPATLPRLHTVYGIEYYRKLVQPELQSAVREVVGDFTPEQLYSTMRAELQERIFEHVSGAVNDQFVTVDAVLIRDVTLPTEIKTAIENKLKEEQEAERYQFTLQKEELEAQRKRIEAQGQAEYQRIITESLSESFLRFKGIEATQQLASSPNAKTVIVGGGEDGLPVILGGQ